MKRVGLCTDCDQPTHEVVATWTDGPDKGFPRHVGAALAGTKRACLVLLSGRRTDWTLCADCHVTPENLPRLWRKACEAYTRESEGKKDDTGLLLYIHETPMGVLYEEPL